MLSSLCKFTYSDSEAVTVEYSLLYCLSASAHMLSLIYRSLKLREHPGAMAAAANHAEIY